MSLQFEYFQYIIVLDSSFLLRAIIDMMCMLEQASGYT